MLRRVLSPAFSFLTLAVVSVVAVGCGGDDGPTYATVKGKVTLNDKPVTVGFVVFIPSGQTSGPASQGSILSDGTYEILGPSGKGVVVGTHKVLLMCPEAGSGPDTGEDPNAGLDPCVIPERYSQESMSDLTATVSEGENLINFDLTP